MTHDQHCCAHGRGLVATATGTGREELTKISIGEHVPTPEPANARVRRRFSCCSAFRRSASRYAARVQLWGLLRRPGSLRSATVACTPLCGRTAGLTPRVSGAGASPTRSSSRPSTRRPPVPCRWTYRTRLVALSRKNTATNTIWCPLVDTWCRHAVQTRVKGVTHAVRLRTAIFRYWTTRSRRPHPSAHGARALIRDLGPWPFVGLRCGFAQTSGADPREGCHGRARPASWPSLRASRPDRAASPLRTYDTRESKRRAPKIYRGDVAFAVDRRT